MKKIHIVIPDLFLPQQLAAYACKDLRLPALEKLLARAESSALDIDTLESWLCRNFGVNELAIAPLTLQAEGLPPSDAYWLRADPVRISMQREEMILNTDVLLSDDEAQQFCNSLNVHFSEDGLQFFAPHPQRWYVKLNHLPAMETHALPQVVGADMHAHLPYGEDALRWHALLNEVQMLFYEHKVNQAREQRGALAVSGIWFWGGGRMTEDFLRPFGSVAGDSGLASAVARAAGITVLKNPGDLPLDFKMLPGDLLVVWEGLRSALQMANIEKWRDAVLQFEKCFAVPLLAALQAGEAGQITLDILSEGASRRFIATRAALWKIWSIPKPLLHYALVSK